MLSNLPDRKSSGGSEEGNKRGRERRSGGVDGDAKEVGRS